LELGNFLIYVVVGCREDEIGGSLDMILAELKDRIEKHDGELVVF